MVTGTELSDVRNSEPFRFPMTHTCHLRIGPPVADQNLGATQISRLLLFTCHGSRWLRSDKRELLPTDLLSGKMGAFFSNRTLHQQNQKGE